MKPCSIGNDRSMNNFTPRSQQVLALARKEADRLGHDYISGEHLLLGIILLGQGVAANVLWKLGIELDAMRRRVEAMVGCGPEKAPIKGLFGRIGERKPWDSVPYTPRFKKIVSLAGKESQGLNHSYVGTEHLLLGILHEGESVAARVLDEFGVDLITTRREIIEELDPSYEPKPADEEQPAAKLRKAIPVDDGIGCHILFGVSRDQKTVASRLIRTFGAEFDRARDEIRVEIDPNHSNGVDFYVVHLNER